MALPMDHSDDINRCIEALCQCGCDAVRATITAMEAGQAVAQTEGMNEVEKRQVLEELRAIMAVYDRG